MQNLQSFDIHGKNRGVLIFAAFWQNVWGKTQKTRNDQEIQRIIRKPRNGPKNKEKVGKLGSLDSL